MDTSTLLLTAPVAVIAFVKALRDTFPKIDGLMVLGAACTAGAGLSYLLTDGEPIKLMLVQGIFWGFSGSGFMVLADRLSPVTNIHNVNAGSDDPKAVH